jgi:hypothetical protein
MDDGWFARVVPAKDTRTRWMSGDCAVDLSFHSSCRPPSLSLAMTAAYMSEPPLDLDGALHLLSVADEVICELRARLALSKGRSDVGWWAREGHRSGLREAAGTKDLNSGGPLTFFKVRKQIPSHHRRERES